jgi:beta-lactamase superfamily II metal-dependent hydrolase
MIHFPSINIDHQCIVYLDSYKKVGEGTFDAYIDFRLSRDLEFFNRRLNTQLSSSTYIELRNLKTAKRLMRGCYYQLNLDILKDVVFERYLEQEEGLIGGFFNLSEMQVPTDNSLEVLQTHALLDNTELSWVNEPEGLDLQVSPSGDMKVFVKNVGQANWNELIVNGETCVLYDAGAELHAKKKDVEDIFNSRRAHLERSKPILVLSHWDMDHIHCLKYLEEEDLRSCFSAIICPNRVKSITSFNLRLKFQMALGKRHVFSLPIPVRTNGIAMHHWRDIGCLSFYLGEMSRNINFCGLVMFVEGISKTSNFTGDCRLSQADNVYKQEMTNIDDYKSHILISPHHGGDYGATHRHYSTPCNNIAISVANNNTYGHPHKDMLKYLSTLGQVIMTKDIGDISFDI